MRNRQEVKILSKKQETKMNIRFAIRVFKQTDKKVIPIMLLYSVTAFLPQLSAIYFSAKITSMFSVGAPAKEIMLNAVFLAVSVFVFSVINSALQKEFRKQMSVIQLSENKILTEIVTGKDYALLEKPDFQVTLKHCQTSLVNNGGIIYSFYASMQSVIGGIFGLVFSIIAISPAIKGFMTFDNSSFLTSWKFAVVMLVSFILCGVITALAGDRVSKKNIKLWKYFTDIFSQFMYWVDFTKEYKRGKDIRIYNSQKMILDEYSDFKSGIAEHRKYSDKKTIVENYTMRIMQAVLTSIIYAFICVKAVGGLMTVDDIVRLTGSIPIIIASVTQLGCIPMMLNYDIANAGYMRKVYDYPTERKMGTLPVEKRTDCDYEIEFKNVSFKYAGSDSYALKDVSFKFKIGEHIAFVGHNGSGKSTFIKLLCRLYDPTEGEITLNGIDIKKYDINEYMSLFSVVFQDFALFSVPLSQNVTTSMDYDRERLFSSLEKSGADKFVNNMKNKENTVLYKDFDDDGVEISGGEAQKLAISRALYRDAPFVVLDEPTAALDPISEFEVYSRFNEFTSGKTAIYISHRLSSCRFCDKILVFEKGHIVQFGTHEKLLSDEKGMYSKLWNSQAKYYVSQV